MVPVKIECDCGQHYAFDVEPVNGRMPSAIACPGCGADGTAAANAILSLFLSSTTRGDGPVVIHPVKQELHLAAPVPVPVPTSVASEASVIAAISKPVGYKPVGYSGRQLGLVGRKQAEVEARAKVSWGDSKETVIEYLMMQGYPHQDAVDLAAVMYKERRATTRANGVRKTLIGSSLMVLAAMIWVFFIHLDALTARVVARLVGVAVLIGCVGIWQFINGAILLLVPGLDKGDVTEQ
jgi:hypothetical protein